MWGYLINNTQESIFHLAALCGRRLVAFIALKIELI